MGSILLGAAMLDKAIKCKQCGNAISETRDYKANIINIPRIGEPPTLDISGEEVTLVCNKCGWTKRTNDWKQFVVVPKTRNNSKKS